MDLGLTDKIAWVPAASQGLGAAIARELAQEGARVVISARREDVLRQVADSIAADTGAGVQDVTTLFGFDSAQCLLGKATNRPMSEEVEQRRECFVDSASPVDSKVKMLLVPPRHVVRPRSFVKVLLYNVSELVSHHHRL